MKKIYEFKLPEDHPNFTGYDDLPTAYRVFESKTATGGVVVEALYNGQWITNPWNTRTLVRQLVTELNNLKESESRKK